MIPLDSAHSLRVLQVIPGLGASTGGPAQAVIGLSRALRRQGHVVSIFSTDLAGTAYGWGLPPRGGASLAQMARCLRVEGIDTRAYPVRWPPRYVYAPQLGRALRREARNFDIVHIHSLYLYPPWAAAHACRAAGIPYIVRPHGILTIYQARQRKRLKQLYDCLLGRETLGGAALIHFTSDTEQHEAEACGYSYPSRVVRLGIDVSTFTTLPPPGRFRARYPAIGEKLVVLFMGRLAPKKGFELLIPAFVRVHAELPVTHLVIAGPDEAGYGEHVRQLVAQHQISDAVTFTGMLTGNDKLEALRDADLWTLPSHAENFGIAVVEAMAAGLAVVISDRVDIHQDIAAAKAGLVVPCAVEPLAQALLMLLNNAQLRVEIGGKARALAHDRFSWDSVTTEMVAMYRAGMAGGE